MIACNSNKEKTLSNLILHKEKIDLLWIAEGKNSAIKIKDKEFISKLIEQTGDIKVSILSTEQEKDFFPKFLNENIILIDFHEELSGDPAYGRMLINIDGTIVTVDITTELLTDMIKSA
ncbi:MAG: hypothetical protein ACOYJ1_08395 [Peptococcales bacterium]|jgi:hypothetical protein